MATENTETRDVWFVIFSAGDGRFKHHGWTAYWKDDVDGRAAAKRGGDRCAHRLGENRFTMYYGIGRTYVTDSPAAFLKKCEKAGINPSPDRLRDYGVEL